MAKSLTSSAKSWASVTMRPSAAIEDIPDGDHFFPDETFYATVNLKDYRARKAEPADIIRIKSFLTDQDYALFKFENPYLLL